jgi:hypothetical protein
MDIESSRVAAIVGDAEIDHAIATLVLAFGTDPVARWMYGEPHHHLMQIPKLFRALGTSSFEAGAAERTADGLGVALWLPPGIHGDDGRLRRLLQQAWLGKSKPKSPRSSSKRSITGQPSPIGICRSSGSKLCIGTRSVVRHYCSIAFANATGNTSQHILVIEPAKYLSLREARLRDCRHDSSGFVAFHISDAAPCALKHRHIQGEG